MARIASKYHQLARTFLRLMDIVRIFRVTPTVISVLDYSKGFTHTDLVTC